MMPNCLQYPVAMFGTLRAGCTVVNVNPLYTARELEHQLKRLGRRGHRDPGELRRRAAAGARAARRSSTSSVTSLGEMLGLKGVIVNLVVRKVKKMVPPFELPGARRASSRRLGEGRGKPLNTPALGHDDIAFLQYTGGTTGVSKGAILLHRNVVAALLQYRAWLGPAMGNERPVIITALPLYHIFSLTVNCLVMMFVGGENMLITNPRDIPGFVKELAKHKYSMITGVNTLFNALLNHPEFAKLDFSHLKLALGGGMAVQKAVAERWKQVTGTPLIEGYGLTETAPSATANPLNHHRVHRRHRRADVLDRHRAARRCRNRSAARPARRDLHPRAAGDEGLLAASRGDRARCWDRTASCAPATSASWTRRASSASSTARRT